MIAGTIRNAVNQMQLVNDWEQKKATGDVVKKQEGMTVTSQEESMIQHFREQLERDKESSAYSQIYNKIASGQELTASEEDAIRQKDPKAYMEYKAARMEQEAYERRLERCKTSIQYIEQMDEKPEDYSQEDDAGLDLIDFYVLPHYLTAPFKKVTEKIMTEFSDLNLCPINNKQAIIVDGSESKVICKD